MDHLHAILNNPPALAGVLYAAYIYYAFIRKSIACRVDVWPSEKSAALKAADLVRATVLRKPNARILFLTGSTPVRSGFFAALKEMHDSKAVDFSKMRVVGGDEVREIHPCF
jgi:hypothetical protein